MHEQVVYDCSWTTVISSFILCYLYSPTWLKIFEYSAKTEWSLTPTCIHISFHHLSWSFVTAKSVHNLPLADLSTGWLACSWTVIWLSLAELSTGWFECLSVLSTGLHDLSWTSYMVTGLKLKCLCLLY